MTTDPRYAPPRLRGADRRGTGARGCARLRKRWRPSATATSTQSWSADRPASRSIPWKMPTSLTGCWWSRCRKARSRSAADGTIPVLQPAFCDTGRRAARGHHRPRGDEFPRPGGGRSTAPHVRRRIGPRRLQRIHPDRLRRSGRAGERLADRPSRSTKACHDWSAASLPT